MYESPISIIETVVQSIIEQRENTIVAKVQDAIDVQVDKGELLRALQYDRGQYDKGYKDGERGAREFAEDVVYQFGYYCQNGGRLHITHGGLSTLEWAFDILGWENPHPVPEYECEIDGCHEHATCGANTIDGYKRMCGKHCRERRTDERNAD